MGSNAFGDRLRTSRSLPSMNASQKVRIDLGGHRLRSARADYQLGASRISKGGKYRKLAPPAGLEPATS